MSEIMVLTPISRSPAIELGNGRLWRKKLLPVGQVQYGAACSTSPLATCGISLSPSGSAPMTRWHFQLAGPDNAHTNDPERFAGEVIDAEVQPDGLYVVVRPPSAVTGCCPRTPAWGECPHRGGLRPLDGGTSRLPCSTSWRPSTRASRSSGRGRTVEASATYDRGPSSSTCAAASSRATRAAGQPLPGAGPSRPHATPAEIDALLDVLDETKTEDEALASWADGVDVPQPRQPGEAELAQMASIRQSIELSSALDELRTIEDAEPLPRLAEDRLSHLLGRIGRGSYTPQPQPGYAPAHHLDPGHPGPVTTSRTAGLPIRWAATACRDITPRTADHRARPRWPKTSASPCGVPPTSPSWAWRGALPISTARR